jgi:hypothetical protein
MIKKQKEEGISGEKKLFLDFGGRFENVIGHNYILAHRFTPLT